MSTCALCTLKGGLFCTICNKIYCYACSSNFHKKDLKLLQHNQYQLCDECEKTQAESYCPICEQKICNQCDNIIHNKGKRALHTRKIFQDQKNLWDNITVIMVISQDIFDNNVWLTSLKKNEIEKKSKIIPNDLLWCKKNLKDEATSISSSELVVEKSRNEIEVTNSIDEKSRIFQWYLDYLLSNNQQISKKEIALILLPTQNEILFNEDLVVRLRKDYEMVLKIEENEMQCYSKSKDEINNSKIYEEIHSESNYGKVIVIKKLVNIIPSIKMIIFIDPFNLYELSMLFFNSNQPVFSNLILYDGCIIPNDQASLKQITKDSISNMKIKLDSPAPIPKNDISKVSPTDNNNNESPSDDYLKFSNVQRFFPAKLFCINPLSLSNQDPILDIQQQQHEIQPNENLFENFHISNQNVQTVNLKDISSSALSSSESESSQKGPILKGMNNEIYPKFNTQFPLLPNEMVPIITNPGTEALSAYSQQIHDQILGYKSNLRTLASQGGSNLYNHSNYIYQQYKEIEIDGSLTLSHYIQDIFKEFAQEGELIISKEDFLAKTASIIETKFNRKVDFVFKKAEELGIMHSIIRKFFGYPSLDFLAINLDYLTIESLTWIIKSIKRDCMTPTEKLILSRIKESFGLKIEQKYWKILIDYTLTMQYDNNMSCVSSNNHSNYSLPQLSMRDVIDPISNMQTCIIYLKNEEWEPEDQGAIDENSELWKIFLAFIDDFFNEDKQTNPHQEASSFLTHTRDKNLRTISSPNPKDAKAIPGGRYGCAQFLKLCGPEPLRKISLGKLNLMVQESINKGILRYQRTLLIKNYSDLSFSTAEKVENEPGATLQDSISKQIELDKRANQLKRIKSAIYEILYENPNGVSLAQIPQYLRRKLDFQFNLQKLGLPKLKNLLVTMSDDIKIESYGTNHSYAILKNPNLKINQYQNKGPNDYQSANLYPYDKKHQQQQAYDPFNMENSIGKYDHKPQDQYTNQDKQINNPLNYLPGYMKAKELNEEYGSNIITEEKLNILSRKKIGLADIKSKTNIKDLNEYLTLILNFINTIIIQYPFGMNINKLYQSLNTKLGYNFDPTCFECQDFYEFLLYYAEKIVDIEIKRNVITSNNNITFNIYPKKILFQALNQHEIRKTNNSYLNNFIGRGIDKNYTEQEGRYGQGQSYGTSRYSGTGGINNPNAINQDKSGGMNSMIGYNSGNWNMHAQSFDYHYPNDNNITQQQYQNIIGNFEHPPTVYDQFYQQQQQEGYNIHPKKTQKANIISSKDANYSFHSLNQPYFYQNYAYSNNYKINTSQNHPYPPHVEYNPNLIKSASHMNPLQSSNQNVIQPSSILHYSSNNQEIFPKATNNKPYNRNMSNYNTNPPLSSTSNNNTKSRAHNIIFTSEKNITRQNPIKESVFKGNEVLNIEGNQNLKFIEELLQDNDDDMKFIDTNSTIDKVNSSYDTRSPNLSIASASISTNLNTINDHYLSQDINSSMKFNHTKRYSEDYKTIMNAHHHTRFNSAAVVMFGNNNQIDTNQNDLENTRKI